MNLSPTIPPLPKPRTAIKRPSSSPPVFTPTIPSTPEDWKRTIAEVKRVHANRRYRACAARCSEILDAVKDTAQAEPVYVIYLHFYAALSLELCAKPLTPSSPYQTSLLNQARTHFDSASELIEAAEQSILNKHRTYSIISSRSSSCHSPSDSVSSRTWTIATSPTNSVCSFEDLAAKSQKPKRTKKVSFSLPPLEKPTFHVVGPPIRPDSPTLGFDDEYFHAGAARQELPEPPMPLPPPTPVELPLTPEPLLLPEDDEPLPATPSVSRYCETLAGLKIQLAGHADSLQESRRASIIGGVKREKEDLRMLDRQARIERLRKDGWQRKRFDARRYEELCDAVMAELS